MVGVVALGAGLERGPFESEPCGLQVGRDALELGTGRLGVHRGAEAVGLRRGVGAEAATDDEPLAADLHVVADAVVLTGDGALVGLVGRLVGTEADVAVRPEEAYLSEKFGDPYRAYLTRVRRYL